MAVSVQDRLRDYTMEGNLWSYSSLSKYQNCAYSWYGRYIMQIQEPPSRALVQGLICHSILESALINKRAPDHWEDAIRNMRMDVPDSDLVPDYMDPEMAAWLSSAWESKFHAQQEYIEQAFVMPISSKRGNPRPSISVVGVEAMLSSNVKYSWFKAKDMLRAAGVDGIYARPDWIGVDEDKVTLVDWKTSAVKSYTTAQKVAGRYRGQVALYLIALQRRFPAVPIESFIYLLPSVSMVNLSIEPADLPAMAASIADTIWSIKESAATGELGFKKNPGDACRFCPMAGNANLCSDGADY